ncbi:enoyl-CoA hydratase/isomerase family protein [Emticicia sp. 17c]|uniref:enoyl-CoA hydratase/isomerase family protein n=1 Tax=Emticicia sp. 17c TaxID=3127704 RepID=UPI00301DF3DF
MYFTEIAIASFDNVSFKFIKTSLNGNVFRITLNRPEKRNAFTPTMVQEIAFALAYAHYNKQIWCVVIEAEGPVFCAGMDLNVFQNPALDTPNNQLPVSNKEITLGDAFKNLLKPCIAKINGDVLAGGFLIIGGCTFVVATESAGFSLPEVRRGIFPMQVMATLLKIMPQRKVLEMCILGKRYTAQEAFELGLVTHLSTNETLENDTAQIINIILQGAPLAISKGLEALNTLSDLPDNEQHHYLINTLQEIRNSSDAQEGIQAFKEKRTPVWTNQ